MRSRRGGGCSRLGARTLDPEIDARTNARLSCFGVIEDPESWAATYKVLPAYCENANESDLSFEEFTALSPNQWAEIMQSGSPRRGPTGVMEQVETVTSESHPTLDEFAALSPNERAAIVQAGVIRDWSQLDPAEQAHIRSKTTELRQRLADA